MCRIRNKKPQGRADSWTGCGKRPNWFKAAIAAGKKPEDLAVK